MKLRGLWIAIGVLAALSGVLYWSNHRKPSESTAKASRDETPRILSVSQADIARLAIHRRDEPQLDLARSDSGQWQITAPKPLTADQDAVSNVLSALSSLNADRLLEQKASALAPYGLTHPALELRVTLKDQKTQELLIGDQTPAGNAYYAMLVGDPRLFTLASYDKSSLDKTSDDLRDKRLLTADFDKVSQIELITQKSDKKEDLVFARNKDAWQLLKPKPFRTDNSQVEELIRSLKSAKFDTGTAADDAKSAAAFQSAAPAAIVKVTGASGAQQFEVRKQKNDFYAKSSVVSGAYKVPATLGSDLGKSLDDFRNKKLFDFGYEDPDKIEVHDGAKAYFLTRSGSDWWGPDGKKLDDGTVQAFLGEVRNLSASRFLDSGFTTPTLEITALSKDGKRVERVLVARHGEEYVAKRENEPELYELSGSAVTDLQKSAADLKPAAAPKK
jgi:hypothetical protein